MAGPRDGIERNAALSIQNSLQPALSAILVQAEKSC
jgi:hypothetical protein